MIDRNLISNVEYQLFIDEMRGKDQYLFPDHWKLPRFPVEEGARHVVGVRFQDAQQFCKWLTEREKGGAKYRLPTLAEAETTPLEEEADFGYWVTDKDSATFHPQKMVPTLFSIRQKTIVKQIQEDIDHLTLLNEALSIPPPKPIDVLIRTGPLPGTGGGGAYHGSMGAGIATEPVIRHRQKIAAMLNENKKLAENLGLDFHQIINVSKQLFLSDLGDLQKATEWLTPKELRYFSELDLDERLESFYELFQELSNHDYGNTILTVVENLQRTLELMLTREWVNRDQITPSEFSRTNEFLRFFARLCAICLGATAKRRRQTHPTEFTIQQNISITCENLIATVAYLEERFKGSRKPIEGIRLVKIS